MWNYGHFSPGIMEYSGMTGTFNQRCPADHRAGLEEEKEARWESRSTRTSLENKGQISKNKASPTPQNFLGRNYCPNGFIRSSITRKLLKTT
jgi:hypothetical protein